MASMIGSYVGIDEVGMGALAGPMLICAVIGNPRKLQGLKDSKKYSPEERKQILPVILSNCDYFLSCANNNEIDKFGLYKCWRLRIEALSEQFGNLPILLDGNRIFSGKNIFSLPKADETDPLVAAASIIAKVTRDEIMVHLSSSYPEYEFDKNKGYYSNHHIKALNQLGPCEIHRKSFLSKILGGAYGQEYTTMEYQIAA